MTTEQNKIPEDWKGLTPLFDYDEGIYFDMPEDEYHKIPYYSNSGADNMFIHPLVFWWNSCFNAAKPPEENKDCLNLGKAFHSMQLEWDKFKELYATAPCKEDYDQDQLIVGNDGLKAFLKEAGLKTDGSKAVLLERAKPLLEGSSYISFDIELEEFEARVKKNKQRVIKKDMRDKLNLMDRIYKMIPDAVEATKDGYAEVTIIWKHEATGVYCKCRVDYLKKEGIVDLKTYSNSQRKNLDKAIRDAITYNRYNRQYVIYRDALATILPKLKSKRAKIHGKVAPKFIEDLIANDKPRFFFVFTLTEMPHPTIVLEAEVSPAIGGTKNVYFEKGMELYEIPIKQYAECFNIYGALSPWVGEFNSQVLMDEEMPSMLYQGYIN